LGSEILLLARGHHGGGKTIWLAGHVGFVDDSGASLAGNFDAQTRQAFKNLEKTLQRAGGTLKVGRLQRQAARCSLVTQEADSVELGTWCWPRVVLIEKRWTVV
jgi:Endoribonuclease L-PSP